MFWLFSSVEAANYAEASESLSCAFCCSNATCRPACFDCCQGQRSSAFDRLKPVDAFPTGCRVDSCFCSLGACAVASAAPSTLFCSGLLSSLDAPFDSF